MGHPRGDWIALHHRSGDESQLRIVNLAGGEQNLVTRNRANMIAFAVSADGMRLFVGLSIHDEGELAAAVDVIDPVSGKQLARLPVLSKRDKMGPGIVPMSLACSTSGERIAVGLRQGVGGTGEVQV